MLHVGSLSRCLRGALGLLESIIIVIITTISCAMKNCVVFALVSVAFHSVDSFVCLFNCLSSFNHSRLICIAYCCALTLSKPSLKQTPPWTTKASLCSCGTLQLTSARVMSHWLWWLPCGMEPVSLLPCFFTQAGEKDLKASTPQTQHTCLHQEHKMHHTRPHHTPHHPPTGVWRR